MTSGERAAIAAALQQATDALARVAEALRHGREAPTSDGLLSAKEAGRRTGMSTRWLYAHADTLPFAVRVGTKAVRFSARGIEKWVEQRVRSKIS